MTELNNEVLRTVDKYNLSLKPSVKEYAAQQNSDIFSSRDVQDLKTTCPDYLNFEYKNEETSNKNTRLTIDIDGQIGDFSQGKKGDCWLMAGIKAMSLNPTTAQILKDVVDDSTEGSWSVDFDGINEIIEVEAHDGVEDDDDWDGDYHGGDYDEYYYSDTDKEPKKEKISTPEKSVITTEELQQAKESGEYSTGDDDVLLFELAFEKIFNKIKSNPDNYNWYFQSITGIKEGDQLNSGLMQFIALAFGDNCDKEINYLRKDTHVDTDMGFNLKETPSLVDTDMPEFLINSEKIGFDNSLDNKDVFSRFESNKNQAAVVSFQDNCLNDDLYAYDTDNNRVFLTGRNMGHAWVLADVNEDKVTLINPWDTQKEYVFNRDEILNYVDNIEYYVDK